MSAREVVLNVMNSSTRPLRREEVYDRVVNEYEHECHSETVYKWLQQLARAGRIVKLDRGLYANTVAAQQWREEEQIG